MSFLRGAGVRRAAATERGMALVGVIVLMLLLTIIVPAMVLWVQNEARWTVKQARSIKAFQLAEAGIDRAYNKVTESTMTWNALQTGGAMSGTGIPASYIFNMGYTDLSSGTYTIAISSGPEAQQVTIYSVGRDYDAKEVRAIKAIYTNNALVDIAVAGVAGVDVTGNNMSVEWGAIVSPKVIDTGGKTYPTFWSASSIDLDTNGSTPPNCDATCAWWHSFYSGIPPLPDIDFDAYKKLAEAADADGGVPKPCGAYYTVGNKDLGSCEDRSGRTYYVTGNITNMSGCVVGNLIALGAFSTANGTLGGCTGPLINATLPRKAWKQYINNWAAYLPAWDATRPAAFPGATSSYRSPAGATVPIDPVISGFLYVGGDFQGPNGGGNTTMVYGVILVKGQVYLNMNSHVKIYYGSDVAEAVKSTRIYLARESWENKVFAWPPGAP